MSSTAAAPALSVVVPVYNEAGNIGPLVREIREVMLTTGETFEVIYVNDGSTDGTLAELQTLGAEEPRLRIIDLDGNFGEAAALSAGFRAARGALVVTLDGDGQNDPRDIPRLLDTLDRNGYRVVSGWRQQRQEGLLLRVLPSRIANRLIALVSGIPTHDNGCGLKVYRRDVVARAAVPRGFNRFMPAIFGVASHEVAEVPVHDRRRHCGRSHYGIGRTLVVLRDLVALRPILSNSKVAEMAALTGGMVSLGFYIYARTQALRSWRWMAGVTVVLAGVIWWDAHRFNRAQRKGVYRVRRQYPAENVSRT